MNWVLIDRAMLYLLVVLSLVALGMSAVTSRDVAQRRLQDQQTAMERQAEIVRELRGVVAELKQSQDDSAASRRQFRRVALLLLDALDVEDDPFKSREPDPQPTGDREPRPVAPPGPDERKREPPERDPEPKRDPPRDKPRDKTSEKPSERPSDPPDDRVCAPVLNVCIDPGDN